jgi:hypothetical protein
LEKALGITMGHDPTLLVIQDYLNRLEAPGRSRSRPVARRPRSSSEGDPG